MISAGPMLSPAGSIPRSTRKGAAIGSARSSGVVKRRFAQLVPSSTRRSPSVCPSAWEGTMTHLARVGSARQRSASWARKGVTSATRYSESAPSGW